MCVGYQFGGKTIRAAAVGLVFLLACGLLQAQLPSLPGAPAPSVNLPDGAARVISQSGRVSVVRNESLWILQPNDIVKPGQEIVAEADGHAILELADTSRVEVFPNSRLTFRANHGDWRDLLDLVLGKVRIHIEKIGGKPNPYRMNSPTALIAVRGTTFEVEVDASSTTTVAVEEGLVSVRHLLRPGKEVEVKPGESLTVYANEPLAQSQIDKLRIATRIIANVTERAVEIMQQVGANRVPGTTGASTPASTTGSTTPTATVGTTTSGSGTGTPPSNGRGSGSGNNGDTSPGTPVGPSTGGSSTTPGTGSSGAPGTGPNSVPSTAQSRKPQ